MTKMYRYITVKYKIKSKIKSKTDYLYFWCLFTFFLSNVRRANFKVRKKHADVHSQLAMTLLIES